MAETAPNPSNGLSIHPDDLAALRAKKQRQLATTSVAPPALPTILSPEAQTQEQEAPAPVAPSSVSVPSPTEPAGTRASPVSKSARKARAASPRSDREGQVMISGYFPVETRRRLKIIAARQDKTLQQVMADAFEGWLRRHDNDG